MGFKIDIKGLDELQRKIKDLQQSIDPNTFEEWANRIALTAKQLCNDPSCERIKIVKTAKGEVTFQFADKDDEAVDCVIKSIERHFSSMPPAQQKTFKELRLLFEAKKSRFESST